MDYFLEKCNKFSPLFILITLVLGYFSYTSAMDAQEIVNNNLLRASAELQKTAIELQKLAETMKSRR
jgi:hypothetical protein